MRVSRPRGKGNRSFEAKSLIRRYHPDGHDQEQFQLQDELQSWSLLWWEKQEQLNKLWYQKLHTDFNNVKRRKAAS